MAVYEYRARDEAGNEFCGTYDNVGSVATLKDDLGKMGYSLVKARRAGRSVKTRRIKPAEVVAFAYKFAGMYSAGLSITGSLETLEEQTENQTFALVIADIRQSIETGSSLKNAFERHRGLFSDFFLGMIEAGEAGGKLSEALDMSAKYLENQMELRRKVKAAFAYPVVVGAVCLLVITGLVIFVVPVFSKVYEQLNVDLPGPTQFLVSLSALIKSRWWAIIIAEVAATLGLRHILKSPAVKAWWDGFKLDMPVFGRLNRMVVVCQFTRTFAMLASVGVSLIDALEVASLVAHNHRLTKISGELQEAVRAGNPVGKSLRNYDIFPPMITQLAISGEEAGTLAEMMNKGADFIDRDIERITHALILKLEPALTIIMGVIVAFILMAVYLPMFDYMQHLK
jgi:type IV pilus assembly protein PilC